MTTNIRGFLEENGPRIVQTQAEERSVQQDQRDIYDSHRHRIFSLAFHMTGNELQAEQLLTDTFVSAFQAHPKPDSAVIDGALITSLRSHFCLVPAAAAPVYSSIEMSGKNVRRTDMEEAIQALPPVERLTFLLRDVEGYPVEAISQLLEMPQLEISRILFSARIRMRNILAEMAAERAA